MTTLKLWMCVGGPLHGQWRPAGDKPIATHKTTANADYAIQNVRWNGWDISPATARITVAIPPRPVLYYPTRVRMAGWCINLTFYVEASIAGGSGQMETGAVIPGGVVGVPMFCERACRWCYGRPMEGMTVCSRSGCIMNVASIESLDTLTADDADWRGDRG